MLVTPDGKHLPFFDFMGKRHRRSATWHARWLERMDTLKKQHRGARRLRKVRIEERQVNGAIPE